MTYLQKNSWINRRTIAGFTIVEMMVTIGIFMTITTVILANFPAYGSKLSLGRVAREMALLFRQAQVYGIAVKEIQVSGGTQQTPPFGIYFDTRSPKEFIFFSDTGPTNGTNRPNMYDDAGVGCTDKAASECEEAFALDGKEYIKSIKVGQNSIYNFPNVPNREITVMFVRPDPDALFYVDGIPEVSASFVTVTIKSISFPDKEKSIRIWNTGQIAVID